jgi:hypothetical protein
VSLSAGETIKSKHSFERFAKAHGVKVKRYRADNHPYSSKAFLDDLESLEQEITFSGVGAHHQNGCSERCLQTVTNWARAAMMHQLLHWPEHFDTALWPFALENAVFIWNNMPRHRKTMTPLELFTKMKQPENGALLRARVWGCPSFVLDPKLHDQGKKVPKWTKRSRQGMYLGMSHDHHSTVGRILNLKTGSVTPQFHVVYDELFSTGFGELSTIPFDKETWTELYRLGSERASDLDHELVAPNKKESLERARDDLFQNLC